MVYFSFPLVCERAKHAACMLRTVSKIVPNSVLQRAIRVIETFQKCPHEEKQGILEGHRDFHRLDKRVMSWS